MGTTKKYLIEVVGKHVFVRLLLQSNTLRGNHVTVRSFECDRCDHCLIPSIMLRKFSLDPF